jgi:tRNA (guanine37-N1)-methyltransferase
MKCILLFCLFPFTLYASFMRFDILTLFPEAFSSYLDTSILGRAKESGRIQVNLWNIRDYTTDKHHTADDTPYGGGPGMVMKVEPIDKALQAVRESGIRNPARGEARQGRLESGKRKIVVLSAKGKQFSQAKALEYASLDSLTLICGRYEGIDQRVIDNLAQEEISIGPYVLAGGELPALVVVEAAARLVPGVLGNPDSLQEESFTAHSSLPTTPSLEYPQYTKPEEYRGWKVPDILLSGNHAAIKDWREEQQKQ